MASPVGHRSRAVFRAPAVVHLLIVALTLTGPGHFARLSAADRIELVVDTYGNITLPRVDAIAARDVAGVLWLAATNVDPAQPVEIAVRLPGIRPRHAAGETLTAPAVDSVNTFDRPNTIVPKPVTARVLGDQLTLTLEPKSVTVLSIRR